MIPAQWRWARNIPRVTLNGNQRARSGRFRTGLFCASLTLIFGSCQPAPTSTVVVVDAPMTEPNGEFGTKVRLPGVTPTDQLLLSPTQSYGTWGVYYDSADTVVVNYNNTTQKAQDPPPVTLRVTYLHF